MFFWFSSVFWVVLIFSCGCSDSKEDEIGTKLFRSDNNSLKSDFLEKNHSQVSDTKFLPETISTEIPISNLSVRRDFYEDGKIKEEIEITNGVKDGFRRKWHTGGIQSVEGTMKDDKWHGVYKEWYSSGMPKLKGQYLEGKQHGEWYFYDKNGEQLPSLFFDNGIEVTRDLPKVFSD